MSNTKNPFPTFYQEFIYKSRYARWLEEEGRRENWDETVNRYLDFFDKKVKEDHPKAYKEYQKVRPELFDAIYNLKAMPSMRLLMTAGKAVDSTNMAAFNCSFLPIDHPRSFDEMMYCLCSGTGVGFSVEHENISKLPVVSDEFYDTDTTIIVDDSRIGWAKAFRELLSLLWSGQVPKVDYSRIRPAGARLKTFGGRASGSGPLKDLFEFCCRTFRAAHGRKLTSIECHDIACKIGEVVVSGGVRRSALISLSDMSDDLIRNAKSGQWWTDNPQRAMANNSYVVESSPDFSVFLKEWNSLYTSKAGERGIINRSALNKKAIKTGRRKPNFRWGCNPCVEAQLRPYGLCNLSEVVVRAEDTEETLLYKVKIASILGTLQSCVTNFKYVRKIWKDTAEEERLLGVSLTGILDKKGLVEDTALLVKLKDQVVNTNKEWADKLGVNQSVATTVVKPSGTVSQLVDSASGLHPRFSEYYIRRVRISKNDPLALFMISKGFDCEDDVANANTSVFSFPTKAPKGAKLVKETTAMDQIRVWDALQENWCEHTASCTVYYKDSEFLEVGSWVFNNIDKLSGLSFLPVSDHVYKQAPYEEITKEQYEDLLASTPTGINWEELALFEKEEGNTGARDLACTGGACEVVDLV